MADLAESHRGNPVSLAMCGGIATSPFGGIDVVGDDAGDDDVLGVVAEAYTSD